MGRGNGVDKKQGLFRTVAKESPNPEGVIRIQAGVSEAEPLKTMGRTIKSPERATETSLRVCHTFRVYCIVVCRAHRGFTPACGLVVPSGLTSHYTLHTPQNHFTTFLPLWI